MFDLGMAADKMEAIFSDLLLENRIRSADRKKAVCGQFLPFWLCFFDCNVNLTNSLKRGVTCSWQWDCASLSKRISDEKSKWHIMQVIWRFLLQRLDAVCQSLWDARRHAYCTID